MFVTAADQPEGHRLKCGLFNDTPFVRLIVRGSWTAQTATGPIHCDRGALMFGPHTRRMPVEVTGPFATIGFALRPGALEALGHPWGVVAPDCIAPLPADGGWADWSKVADIAAHEAEYWLHCLEEALRVRIAPVGPRNPNPLAEALDRAALADPGQTIAAFAQRHGVSTRRVERMARRAFGMSPKQVMRRARVLDMASQLLGFADAEEAEEQALRFYDQSHLICDFRALLGCTPRQLARSPQPILTLGLEPRQARRLELLGKLDTGRPAPWR